MPQLIIGILVLVLVFYLVAAVIGAGIWVAVLALLTLPAGAAAYGSMLTAENFYCRKKVKELHQRGKLSDILQLYFKDSMLHWNLDATAITDFSGHGTLRLLLFAVGFITVWVGLFILGKIGAFEIDLGTSMTGWNTGVVYKINEIAAYVIGSGAIGCALVLLPRSFHQVMTTQAGLHIQKNKSHLDEATRQYQAAVSLHEATAIPVMETANVTIIKKLDACDVALNSPGLADFLKREEWQAFETHVAGIIADIELLKSIAENYHAEDAGFEGEEQPSSNGETLTTAIAFQRLGFAPEESPSAEDVKQAFRDLSHTYHPDKTGGLEDSQRKRRTELFKLIKDAYQFLQTQGKA